jgi:hypothetical protein
MRTSAEGPTLRDGACCPELALDGRRFQVYDFCRVEESRAQEPCHHPRNVNRTQIEGIEVVPDSPESASDRLPGQAEPVTAATR